MGGSGSGGGRVCGLDSGEKKAVLLDDVDWGGETLELGDDGSPGGIWAKTEAGMILACVSVAIFAPWIWALDILDMDESRETRKSSGEYSCSCSASTGGGGRSSLGGGRGGGRSVNLRVWRTEKGRVRSLFVRVGEAAGTFVGIWEMSGLSGIGSNGEKKAVERCVLHAEKRDFNPWSPPAALSSTDISEKRECPWKEVASENREGPPWKDVASENLDGPLMKSVTSENRERPWNDDASENRDEGCTISGESGSSNEPDAEDGDMDIGMDKMGSGSEGDTMSCGADADADTGSRKCVSIS